MQTRDSDEVLSEQDDSDYPTIFVFPERVSPTKEKSKP